MIMTEKYYTLPPPSPSSSLCYSTIYHSPKTTRIREIKTRLHSQRKSSTLNQPNHMKLLLEQQPIIRTYSLHDVQERINYFEKKTLLDDKGKFSVHSNPSSSSSPSSSSGDTLQSVIANTLQQTYLKTESYGSALSRAMMNSAIISKRRSLSSSPINSSNEQKRSQRYCSLISKRARTYSLSNHSTMVITATTSFSEEQTTEQPQETTSIDFENTYFYLEETTRLDDVLSFTTITPNIQPKITLDVCSDTTISQSDTEDNSEGFSCSVQQYGDTYHIKNDDEIIQIRLSLTPTDHEFTGVVHATKCTIIQDKECLSDYDNVNQHNQIRSNVDNVSLTLSPCRQRISLVDEQLNQQDKQTNHDDCINIDQRSMIHSIKMKNDMKMIIQHPNDPDEHDDDDGEYSDISNCSDDFR